MLAILLWTAVVLVLFALGGKLADNIERAKAQAANAAAYAAAEQVRAIVRDELAAERRRRSRRKV